MRYKIILRLVIAVCLGVGGLVQSGEAGLAPYLSYPGFPVKEVRLAGFKDMVYVQVVSEPFAKVARYFIAQSIRSDWQLVFPNEHELKIWLEALQKDSRQPAVLSLFLINTKLKINLNLTIGEVFNASLVKPKTIITMYITKRPFGR